VAAQWRRFVRFFARLFPPSYYALMEAAGDTALVWAALGAALGADITVHGVRLLILTVMGPDATVIAGMRSVSVPLIRSLTAACQLSEWQRGFSGCGFQGV
jgi:urease accessory protein UreF